MEVCTDISNKLHKLQKVYVGAWRFRDPSLKAAGLCGVGKWIMQGSDMQKSTADRYV